MKPSQAAKDFRQRVWARKAAGIALAALATFLMFNGMKWGFFVLIPAGLIFFGEASGFAPIQQQRSRTEGAWRASIDRWNREAGSGRFDEKKGSLVQAAASYRALPNIERTMLQALENKKRDLQLQKYLEAHKISKANIDSIGDGRKMTLRSFGIETAWDIKVRSIRAIPGFGAVLTSKLTSWQRSVESRFIFNANIPTDPAEIAKVRAEISVRRQAMETTLLKGIAELETIKAEALAKRREAKQYQAAYLEFRQAEVDVAYIKGH